MKTVYKLGKHVTGLRGLLIVCLSVLASFVFADILEGFSTELEHSTKCFSCEKALPPSMKWLGQDTKCFDCEKDLIRRSGKQDAAFGAHDVRF